VPHKDVRGVFADDRGKNPPDLSAANCCDAKVSASNKEGLQCSGVSSYCCIIGEIVQDNANGIELPHTSVLLDLSNGFLTVYDILEICLRPLCKKELLPRACLKHITLVSFDNLPVGVPTVPASRREDIDSLEASSPAIFLS
jgi:hypothetical protein